MAASTEHDPLEIVSAKTLERELNLVSSAAAGSLSGIFGPRSMTWRVKREAAIFLGAGRALLLQLAHPWVAAAIEHRYGQAERDGARQFIARARRLNPLLPSRLRYV